MQMFICYFGSGLVVVFFHSDVWLCMWRLSNDCQISGILKAFLSSFTDHVPV